MKKISIFGSTGSVGTQVLSVINDHQDKFKVSCLSCKRNADLLLDQVRQFMPIKVAIDKIDSSHPLNGFCKKHHIELIVGEDASHILSQYNEIDLTVNSIVGSAGLIPTINTVSNNIDLALSNKESLVLGGHIIMPLLDNNDSQIIPVDSEHSAIFQCLHGEPDNSLKKIILTGSGGPFLERPLDSFDTITKEEALNHPKWNMGNKISIDSATMMNKGLEYVEALWLFGINTDQLDIVIHPQSIVHSFVQFIDDSYKAQLGVPDMKVPIQYALTYPQHVTASWDKLDLTQVGQLTFDEKDLDRFPCIGLGYQALRSGGTTPAVLNVANDNAVYNFLEERIKFTDIPRLIEETCAAHDWIEHPNLEELLNLELWAEEFVRNAIEA